MAGKTTTKKTARASADKSGAGSKKNTGFTAEEKAAARERVRELKAETTRGADRSAGEADVLAKIAEMKGSDRTMAERIHSIVKDSAPELSPKTWYGMPAYARDGKVLCFFTPAAKFKERYATFGFNPLANLDDGNMWPTSWALVRLTAAEEKKIAALMKRAARPGGSRRSRG